MSSNFLSQVQGLTYLRLKKIQHSHYNASESLTRYLILPLLLLVLCGRLSYFEEDDTHELSIPREDLFERNYRFNNDYNCDFKKDRIAIVLEDKPEFVKFIQSQDGLEEMFEVFQSMEELRQVKHQSFCLVASYFDHKLEFYLEDYSDETFRRLRDAYSRNQALTNLIYNYLVSRGKRGLNPGNLPLVRPILGYDVPTRFGRNHIPYLPGDPQNQYVSLRGMWRLLDGPRNNGIPYLFLLLAMLMNFYVQAIFDLRETKMFVILKSHGMRTWPRRVSNALFHILFDYSVWAAVLVAPIYYFLPIKTSPLVFFLGYGLLVAHAHALVNLIATVCRSRIWATLLVNILGYGSIILYVGIVKFAATSVCDQDTSQVTFCFLPDYRILRVLFGMFFPVFLAPVFEMTILGYENTLETRGAGLYDVVNFWNPQEEGSGFGLNSVFLTFTFSILFLQLVILYLGEIVPQQDGSGNSRSPLFPVTFIMNLVKGQKSTDSAGASTNETKPLLGDQAFLRCEDLCKTFSNLMGDRKVKAVQNFNWDLDISKIYTLLGVNGAGKSTTIAMITGQLSIDSGRVYLQGVPIDQDREAFLQSVGVCFQENRTFDFLTVDQHLWVLELLRGGQRTSMTQNLLETMNLNCNARISSLSGGQKRKLCLIFAYSQETAGIVILDEPTAGVDQASREKVWRAISGYRTGRVTLLTTHFMDEAEYLSDEIAIMKDGGVSTKGSPNELRKRYNSGFVLSLSEGQQPLATLKSLIPPFLKGDFVFESESLLKIRVNYDRKQELMDFIQQTIKDQWEFSIELISLGDVLQRVADAGVEEAPAIEGYSNSGGQDSTIFHQMKACGIKRVTQIRRNPLYFGYSYFLGTLIIIVMLVVGPVFPFEKLINLYNKTDQRLDFSGHDQTRLGVTSQAAFPSLKREALTTESWNSQEKPLFFLPVAESSLKKIFLTQPKKSSPIFMIDGPDGSPRYVINTAYPRDLVQADLEVANYLLKESQQPPVTFSMVPLSDIYPKAEKVFAGLVMSKSSKLEQDAKSDSESVAAFYFLIAGLLVLAFRVCALAALKDFPSFAEISKAKGETELRVWQYMSGLSPSAYWLSHWLTDSLTLLVNMLLLVMVWLIMLKAKFPDLEWERVHRACSLIYPHFLVFPLAFPAYSYFWQQAGYTGRFPRIIQISSRILLYCTRNFFFLLLPVSIMMNLSSLDLLAHVKKTQNMGMTPENVIMTCLSYTSSAMYWLFRVNPGFGFANSLLCGGIGTGDEITFKNLTLIDPNFDSQEVVDAIFRGNVSEDVWDRDVWDINNRMSSYRRKHCGSTYANVDLILTCVAMILYMTLMIVMDIYNWQPGKATKIEESFLVDKPIAPEINRDLPEIYQQDEGVLKAREMIKNGVITEENQEIFIRDVHKVYPDGLDPVHAVRGTSLGIGQSEVFGLLGVNGAGKSSLFYMLTGVELPSRGDVFIRGTNTRSDLSDVRKKFGYTPQENLLLPNMTVRDHLKFFALLRNAPDVDSEVEQKIRLLDLEEVRNRLAGHCSGGFKRRFLAAISFISDPQMLFLDEPLTGVDVLAAHKFYQVLQAFTKGSARKDLEQASSPVIVLTTHRMVEAEEMCSRIAIMRDGKFVVLGRINELVNRYCSGCEITLKPLPLDPVQLQSEYENFRNQHPGDFSFQDLLTFCHLTPNDRLGTLFDKIEGFKEVHPLTKSAALEILGYAQEIKTFEGFLDSLQDEAQIESAHIKLDSLIVTSKLSAYQALTIMQNSPILKQVQDYLVTSINISRVFKDIADGQLELTL